MSEPVLERSVLERKERDELQTIARAMGASPPSRAKKADLVDLILASAGIAPSAGEGGGAAPGGGGDDEPAPRPRRRTRSRGAPDAEAADQAKADGAADADQPASLFDEGAEPTGRTGEDDDGGSGRERGRGRRRGGDDRSGREGDDGAEAAGRTDEGRGDQAERGSTERAERDRADNGGRDRGETGGRGDTAENGQQDEGEGGNRRRRRRGRDRDRGGSSDEAFTGEPVEVAGLLDLRDEGYGFLRTRGYLPSKDDVYVSVKQVRQFSLRKGDHVTGASRPATRNEKNPALLRIDQVNGREPDAARERPRFEELTPVAPADRLRLGSDPSNTTARVVDLVAPLGRGQRGLVISPPNAGQTTLLRDLARALDADEPDVTLFVVLIDERPEDVTEVRRATSGEVVASTFDRPAEEHTSVAELVLERAKRLAEDGGDVVLLVDGITRLARAHNLTAPGTGRVASGGVDAAALHPTKRFFGTARNLEEGGSITILATVLAETGSTLDQVVLDELRGAANSELRLDRRLADAGLFPAVDVGASSTRREELLRDGDELEQVRALRRSLPAPADGAPADAALEHLLDGVRAHASNTELLAEARRA